MRALDVQCPLCDALPDQDCVRPNGMTAFRVHEMRVRLAKASEENQEGCLVCRRPLSPTCHDRSAQPGPEVSEGVVRRWYADASGSPRNFAAYTALLL